MCFTLRLHMSAAPPQGGLTPALGGKEHSANALSALQLFGFGQRCSSDDSWARSHFGDIAGRAHTSHASRSLPSEALFALRRVRLHLIRSLRQHLVESSWGALRHPGFGLSASTPRIHPRRLPSRLTSRSSRRRVVASLKLPGMRAILAPIRRVRRGLTPALGGEKRSVVVLFVAAIHRRRPVLLFG